jgi:pentatricopeptide repeat protein
MLVQNKGNDAMFNYLMKGGNTDEMLKVWTLLYSI